MSKDVNNYRPTSFSSKTPLGEPMATRGVAVSTNTSDDSNDGSEVNNIEDFLRENPLPDEAINLICRLPPNCNLLTSDDSIDSLTMSELITVSHALKINNVQTLATKTKSRKNKESGSEAKVQILSLIADKFGENWTILYDIAQDTKNSSRSLRRRKPNKSATSSTSSFEQFEPKLSGNRSEINQALAHTQKSKYPPTRDELIFLTDEEYESALNFYKATHPMFVTPNDKDRGQDVTTLLQVYGVVKETTEAIKSYYQHEQATSKYIEKIKEHLKTKRCDASTFQNLSNTQPDSDSSDEH